MNENRLKDYLDHMQQAALDACAFVQGPSQEDFRRDKRTQQAVVMSLIILGEGASKVVDAYPDFAQTHAQIPWRSMRGMRNRVARGYFDINIDLVCAHRADRAARAMAGRAPAGRRVRPP
ncbi:HepT-like ribonuclease domain-containing protein [Comamonas flocculans]|uniref:HepT-like ribonuclease domain-containing protein n=1 Tax=Comamonas flocculans TaxID=2597701 RepID=UPI003D7C04E4